MFTETMDEVKSMEKRNVIFDIGNVLMDWRPRLGGVFDEDTVAVVERAIFDSGLWTSMDYGIEDDREIIEKMVAQAPSYREQIWYVMEHLDLLAEQFDYTKEWIAELKGQGYGVYYLSNYGKYLREQQPQVTDFTPLMDGGIFSCDVHLVKPDRRIYELLCERYNLVPEDCVFVDDRQDNVDGAIAVGMRAVRFDGYEQSYELVMRALEA
jgi:putative hydrolase of the HAD superfamily